MTQKNGGVFASDSAAERIEELRREAAAFEDKLKEMDDEIHRLMQEEDIPAGKVYAAEIHELRQDRMRVKVEILAVQQKIKCLSLGYGEDAVDMLSASAPPFVQ